MAQSKERIKNDFYDQIVKTNRRLSTIAGKYGTESNIYKHYERQIKRQFRLYGESSLLTETSAGVLKIKAKEASISFAAYRKNERSIFQGSLASVPTLKTLKSETARKLGIKESKVTEAAITSSLSKEDNVKEMIQLVYSLDIGDTGLKILFKELYREGGNNGKLNLSTIEKIYDAVKNIEGLDTSSIKDLRAIRKKVMMND